MTLTPQEARQQFLADKIEISTKIKELITLANSKSFKDLKVILEIIDNKICCDPVDLEDIISKLQ